MGQGESNQHYRESKVFLGIYHQPPFSKLQGMYEENVYLPTP